MKRQIFRAILTVALAVLLSGVALIMGVLCGYFQDRMTAELAKSTAYIAHGLETQGRAYLTGGLPRDSRVTWVAADGTVLFDSREDPAGMENHAGREEIRDALLLGHGAAVRHSDTLSQKTVYYALRLEDGSVLRLAETQYSLWLLLLQAMQPVALVVLLAACLALWLAGRVSRRLVEPINAIDLDEPDSAAYEELAPLVGRLRSQNLRIRRQVADLRRQREEFAAITENMSEGLLVIDRETQVLSYNTAALRLLGVEGPVEAGESVLALDREAGFRRCVEEALAGRRREELLGDLCRRVLASPVEQDGAVAGAVLLVLDVTEREQREALRREFTANVSHELKTPLTAILGTAEILENGLVKPGDIPHFAGNIRREAQRLIGLVNDIIKLSRLDEGGPTAQWETVDLYRTAEDVLEQLRPAAERKQVTVTLEGGAAPVRGVPQIVEEIVYNLCDNAVAYNRIGGSVAVTVSAGTEGGRIAVSDTGTGIPREARERVFERFYRVDKSHSGGGTGLGLSIVKHGAAYLGARVELDSEPGRGSTFTVTFPPVGP
ncbi:ATP-binding protein [uncultured Dysosmobacter sp.]|uniref:sensor histidine kinase n=1 Tax=uncultured Dysosmobacter sp. TaxID=2591384 RepID=UPI002631F2AB|nr:ATP-binding protein [uncultured Dysosmobacter sp.]